MAQKLVLMHNFVKIFLIVASISCVTGTLYTVGDSSGWDISTDLDSWVQDKTFLPGDSLLFQFSSYHSLVELPREDFESCNTTNLVSQQSNTSSSGNTTIPLNLPGNRFFSCGNSLHCLAGMKLQVHVVSNQTSTVQPTGLPADGPTSSIPAPSFTSSASGLLFKGLYMNCYCWMVVAGLFGCLIF